MNRFTTPPGLHVVMAIKQPADFTAFYGALDAVKRRVVDHNSDIVEFKKGEVIVEQLAEADAAYAVERGVVEVFVRTEDNDSERSVAYLSRGDLFGELGILTGQPRIAGVRACENAWLRKFTGEQFVRLIERIPAFGLYLTTSLAGRLHRATADQYFMSYCVDFSGNTENFDLLIIFQTLQSSGRTGELRLTNANSDVVGSFFFSNGNVTQACFLHLHGVEAVWQLFLEEKLVGTFVFQITKKPTFKHDNAHDISLAGMDLLMQAATKRDMYQTLDPNLKNLDRTLTRRVEEIDWRDPETAAAADEVWQHVQKKPQTLGTIWRLSNLSVATILDVVQIMLERQFAVLSDSE